MRRRYVAAGAHRTSGSVYRGFTAAVRYVPAQGGRRLSRRVTNIAVLSGPGADADWCVDKSL